MHVSILAVAVVALFTELSSAAPSSGAAKCYTNIKTNSALWNTATTTSTTFYPCTTTTTKTVTSTKTPAKPTSTVTSTVTTTVTAATTTSTATVTATTTTGTTSTETDTATTTSTSTTVAGVAATVAAPATFTPVQSSLPGSAYSGAEGSVPFKKRGIRVGRAKIAPAYNVSSNTGTSPQRYPAGITCYQAKPSPTCSKATSSVTTVVTASPPAATTITTTTTATVTFYPAATTTVTTTSTVTTTAVVTSITTSTATATLTQTSTTTTLYAACTSNNLADNISGSGLSSTGTSGSYDAAFADGPTNAYECCAAAFAYSQPVLVWVWNYAGYGRCELDYATGANAVCDQTSTSNQWYINDGVPIGEAAGNGPCGVFNAVG